MIRELKLFYIFQDHSSAADLLKALQDIPITLEALQVLHLNLVMKNIVYLQHSSQNKIFIMLIAALLFILAI